MVRVLHQYDRPTPAWTKRVLRKYGVNPYGENIYRVVWSEARLEKVGGMWHDRMNQGEESHLEVRGQMVVDSNPVIRVVPQYRTVPRYSFEPCWVIEKWLPCSHTRDQWATDPRFMDMECGLHLLGPYPEHGDFHFSYKLQQRGKFIPLTAGVIDYYARLCEAGQQYTDTQRRLAIEERVASEKRAYDNRFDAIFHDAQLAGGTTNLFMSMSGPKSKARTKPEDVNLVDAKDVGLPTTPGFRQI